MFKIMFILFVFACLYIIWGELKKAWLKKKAEDEFVKAQTESEVLSMMEETKNLEEENRKRKEALYKAEEDSIPF